MIFKSPALGFPRWIHLCGLVILVIKAVSGAIVNCGSALGTVGEAVNLTCNTAKVVELSWGVRNGNNPDPVLIIIDPTGEKFDDNINSTGYAHRVRFTGSKSAGKSYFEIERLTLSDSKEYMWKIDDGEGGGYKFYVMDLRVLPATTTSAPTTVPETTASTSSAGTGTDIAPNVTTTTAPNVTTTTETTTDPPRNDTTKPVKHWIAPVAGVCGGVLLVLIVILCCYCFCPEYLFKCCDHFCCCCPQAVRDWFHRVFCDCCRDCCSFCCGVCCCCCAKYIKKQEHEMKPLPADSTGAPSAASTAAPPAATTAVSPADTTAATTAAPPAATTAATTAASHKSNRSE